MLSREAEVLDVAKEEVPGYSTFVNLLDYTACVLPVTNADKKLDVPDEEGTAWGVEDKKVRAACEYFRYELMDEG